MVGTMNCMIIWSLVFCLHEDEFGTVLKKKRTDLEATVCKALDESWCVIYGPREAKVFMTYHGCKSSNTRVSQRTCGLGTTCACKPG